MISASEEQTEYVTTLYDAVISDLQSGQYDDMNLLSVVYSDEMLDYTAGVMAKEGIVVASNYYEELPGVCESGQECRDTVGATTHANVKAEWILAFNNIRIELENAVLRSGPHLQAGYTAAVECDPGCGPDCDEVEIELANAWDEMERIMSEIRVL